MNYADLFSRNLPAEVDGPPGLGEDTRYVFSVTYTDLDTMPVEGFVDALADIMPREGTDLAKYPRRRVIPDCASTSPSPFGRTGAWTSLSKASSSAQARAAPSA